MKCKVCGGDKWIEYYRAGSDWPFVKCAGCAE